jgi:hypothetical protein
MELMKPTTHNPHYDPDELLYPRQVLELLGLPPTSRATLLRAVREGKIPAAIMTPGGHRKYRREDVLRYRDELRSRASAPKPEARDGGPANPLRLVDRLGP